MLFRKHTLLIGSDIFSRAHDLSLTAAAHSFHVSVPLGHRKDNLIDLSDTFEDSMITENKLYLEGS